MMAGAGAAIEGFIKVARTPLGYDPHNVMSVGIPIHDGTYKTWPERAAYFQQIFAKVAEVPGVKMVAVSSNATPPSNGFTVQLEIVGKPTMMIRPFDSTWSARNISQCSTSRSCKEESGMRLRRNAARRSSWSTDAFVKQYFPAGDAIGHSINAQELKPQPPYFLLAPGAENGLLIVGVVADKLDDGLSKPILPEAFMPYTLAMGMYTQILVRSDVPPLTLLHAVRPQ